MDMKINLIIAEGGIVTVEVSKHGAVIFSQTYIDENTPYIQEYADVTEDILDDIFARR